MRSRSSLDRGRKLAATSILLLPCAGETIDWCNTPAETPIRTPYGLKVLGNAVEVELEVADQIDD